MKWSGGDKAALDELIPLVYNELRRLAASYLRRRGGCHTLQPTALVNEAYVRLAGRAGAPVQHRAQFFGLAAKVMRDILVDHARRRLADPVTVRGYENSDSLLAVISLREKFARTLQLLLKLCHYNA